MLAIHELSRAVEHVDGSGSGCGRGRAALLRLTRMGGGTGCATAAPVFAGIACRERQCVVGVAATGLGGGVSVASTHRGTACSGRRTAPRRGTESSRRWSEAEQGAAAAATSADIEGQIAKGNRAYEAKFGRVFLVRATGRSAAEILAIMQQRLSRTAEAELQEAAEQQRQITHLRLQRSLAEHERAEPNA